MNNPTIITPGVINNEEIEVRFEVLMKWGTAWKCLNISEDFTTSGAKPGRPMCDGGCAPPIFPIGFSQEKKDKSESRREERREEVTQALIGILSSDHCRSNASRTFLVPNVGFVQKKWVMCKKLLVQFEICDRPSACGIPNFATTLSAIIHPPLSLILSAPLGPNSGLCFSWLHHHFC